MKKTTIVRDYYVLPCCLLLLNLCVEVVSYKTKTIFDPYVRTGVIMGMVLIGGSLVGFLVSPLIGALVGRLQRGSRQTAGTLGEVGYLLALGLIIFWLYFRVYTHGAQSILPPAWRN